MFLENFILLDIIRDTHTIMTEIIAEVSVHDGSFGNAKNLIGLAKECGADTVKFQHHIPDYETLRTAPPVTSREKIGSTTF